MAHLHGPLALFLLALTALCLVMALSSWGPLRDLAIMLAGFTATVGLVAAIVFFVYGWPAQAASCTVAGAVGLALTTLTLRVVRRTERRLRAPHPRPVHH